MNVVTSDAGAEYVRLPIYAQKLRQALEVTPSDLEANHAGCLGESQRSRYIRTVASSVAKSFVLLLLACAGIAGWFIAGVASILGLIPLFLAALFVAWIALFARYIPAVWRDVSGAAVSSVEGFVEPVERQRNVPIVYGTLPIWSYYWLVDGDRRFWVDGKAYPVLIPARHRLYFLPSSRRVVAAEPI